MGRGKSLIAADQVPVDDEPETRRGPQLHLALRVETDPDQGRHVLRVVPARS